MNDRAADLQALRVSVGLGAPGVASGRREGSVRRATSRSVRSALGGRSFGQHIHVIIHSTGSKVEARGIGASAHRLLTAANAMANVVCPHSVICVPYRTAYCGLRCMTTVRVVCRRAVCGVRSAERPRRWPRGMRPPRRWRCATAWAQYGVILTVIWRGSHGAPFRGGARP